MPMNMNAEAKPVQLVEHLSPTNIDGLFVNQNVKAERDILKEFNMPGELIGAQTETAFSSTSYNEAWNMKNEDVQGDRNIIERELNKILPNSCFGITEAELVRMEMKGGNDKQSSNDFR
jgi:hypothetical protein